VATVYLSSAALIEIADAQADFDAHVVSSGDGRCVTCAGSPCSGQGHALRVLAGYGQLPRRRPGATEPERVGLRPMRLLQRARG
jgi:hypothetical protein